MPAVRHFSESYAEARARFIDAATRTGAPSASFENPVGKGPTGETLATDVALFGPADATKLLILVSGTHGVEGFAGSGAQVTMIESLRFSALPARTAVLLIHAINPYGFAWLRRTNEDNVDLNRNSIDFARLPAPHEDYISIAPRLVPQAWAELAPAEDAINAFIATHGFRRYQEVVAGGQYTHPEGLFYGGSAPVWSTGIFREIVSSYGRGKERIALIDIHTGLGPQGYGEPIYTGISDTEAERAREWYGPDLTSIHAGNSSSVVVQGPLINAVGSFFDEDATRPEVTTLALEFGTLPEEMVLDLLRAEAWMHAHGDINFDTPVGRAIKRRFRDAFYVDTESWKRSVVERTVEMTGQALAGLAS
ncbi:MAG: M14 family metallopeptidase [Burkholderiaceae bacterium]